MLDLLIWQFSKKKKKTYISNAMSYQWLSNIKNFLKCKIFLIPNVSLSRRIFFAKKNSLHLKRTMEFT